MRWHLLYSETTHMIRINIAYKALRMNAALFSVYSFSETTHTTFRKLFPFSHEVDAMLTNHEGCQRIALLQEVAYKI